jgi:hypothetical protein
MICRFKRLLYKLLSWRQRHDHLGTTCKNRTISNFQRCTSRLIHENQNAVPRFV